MSALVPKNVTKLHCYRFESIGESKGFLTLTTTVFGQTATNGTFQRYFLISTNLENAYSQYYSQFLFVAGNDPVILFIYEFQCTDRLV